MVRSLLQQAETQHEAIDFIPLAYFGSQHLNYYRDVAAAPTEMAMSLLLQLLDRYRGFSSNVLRQTKDHIDPYDLHGIFDSLGCLVKRLPENVVVYLVVEGTSHFNTPPERQKGMQDAVENIVDIYRQQSKATLKFVFVSATRSRNLEYLFDDDEIFNVPSDPTPVGDPFLNDIERW